MEKNRLEVIASFVENGAKVADIGSDHCQVPILLCKRGTFAFIEAVENKKGPYKRMCEEIKKSGFNNIIIPSLSDGIEKIPDCIDTIVIAGMGGRLIKRILESNIKKLDNIDTIIIDAHNDRDVISEFLMNSRYELADNEFFYDANKPYDVMKWKKVKVIRAYSNKELEYGPLNLLKKPEAWRHYWQKEQERLNYLLVNENMPDNIKNKYKLKIEEIDEILKR